ncbi:MAG TPA: hypothetical protein PKD37_01475 [Oligoflexia bacterium]|nr:hypothetical protein [Oligoflexia bacterium]HMP26646.1 hypothetical protein [Oligoflexia bacterium]
MITILRLEYFPVALIFAALLPFGRGALPFFVGLAVIGGLFGGESISLLFFLPILFAASLALAGVVLSFSKLNSSEYSLAIFFSLGFLLFLGDDLGGVATNFGKTNFFSLAVLAKFFKGSLVAGLCVIVLVLLVEISFAVVFASQIKLLTPLLRCVRYSLAVSFSLVFAGVFYQLIR